MELESLIIIIVAILVGVSGQIAYLFIIDHEMMKVTKAKMKELQAQLKQVKPDDPRFKELYKQVMAENSKMMKESFKPTFVTFIPFLIVFFLMSYFFNYAPVAVGVPIQMAVIGHVNGTLFSAGNCATFNKADNITMLSSSSITSQVSFSNAKCMMLLKQGTATYNTSLSGLIGAASIKTYPIDNISLKFTPNTYIVTSMPFSIPFIGNKLNWFWTYFIVTFLSSIALNRVFAHYKLIS